MDKSDKVLIFLVRLIFGFIVFMGISSVALVSPDITTKVVFFGIATIFTVLFALIARASGWPIIIPED